MLLYFFLFPVDFDFHLVKQGIDAFKKIKAGFTDMNSLPPAEIDIGIYLILSFFLAQGKQSIHDMLFSEIKSL
jgi:hypothetical protein